MPVGAFCGNCGAALADLRGGARLHAYTVAPHEHVLRPAIVSTLFSHLPHRHAHVFREALAIGILVVAVLAALQLYTSALLAAVLLLPILDLVYLYETQVYQDRPATVLAASFLAPAALGASFGFLTTHLITPALTGTRQGPVVSGLLLPLLLQLLLLGGPLLLLTRPQFDETLDGMAFGVTAALAFTLGAVLAGYWHELTGPLQGGGSASADSILRLFRAGILVAIVNACTTAMITAAWWLRARGRSRHRHARRWLGLEATVAVGFGAQVILGLASYFILSLVALVVLWAAAAALLLVWLRVVVHHALLDEGAALRVDAWSACPECPRLVPAMAFCPACGVHRSARPRGLWQAARPVRASDA